MPVDAVCHGTMKIAPQSAVHIDTMFEGRARRRPKSFRVSEQLSLCGECALPNTEEVDIRANIAETRYSSGRADKRICKELSGDDIPSASASHRDWIRNYVERI